MKFFILLFFAFTIVHTEDQKQFIASMKTLISNAVKTCQKDKCALACFLKQIKVVTADGALDKVSLLKISERVKKFDPDVGAKLHGALEACVTKVKKGADPCKYAQETFLCYDAEKEARGIPDSPILL